jgi:hypothetical protein
LELKIADMTNHSTVATLHSPFGATLEIKMAEEILQTEDCSDSLPIPKMGDSAVLLNSKLTALVEAVLSGQSITLATKFAAVEFQERSATEKAINEMHPREHDWWQAYIGNRCQLPTINWSLDHDTIPTSPKSLRVARRRAEALNYLYKTDQASPGHSVWFTANHPEYLPLVKAMARVIGAERNLLGGQSTLNATQLADLQSINRILSISGQILEDNGRDLLSSEIGKAQRILGAQRESLRSLLRGREMKRK